MFSEFWHTSFGESWPFWAHFLMSSVFRSTSWAFLEFLLETSPRNGRRLEAPLLLGHVDSTNNKAAMKTRWDWASWPLPAW